MSKPTKRSLSDAKRNPPRKKAAPGPAPIGRPSGYQPAYAKAAEKMCQLGAVDHDLAEAFGVSTTTIWRWQSQHETFCNAVKAGKDVADTRVERALYQRAVGFTYHTEKLWCHEGEVTRADTVEFVVPDVNAAKHWLNNRKPKEWRDKATVEHEGNAFVELLAMAVKDDPRLEAILPPNPHRDENDNYKDAGGRDDGKA